MSKNLVISYIVVTVKVLHSPTSPQNLGSWLIAQVYLGELKFLFSLS